jgi:hypothetical protein
MNNSPVQMHPDTVEVVSERSRIWKEFDDVSARTREIDTLSQNVRGASGDAPKINAVAGDVPPQEIEASIREMRLELDEISKLERNIKGHEATIANIRSRVNTIYLVGGIAFVIVVVWLLMVFAG